MVIKKDKKKKMLVLVVIVRSEHLNGKESGKGRVNFYQGKNQRTQAICRGS